ncbi:MAG: hypothetical protein ABWX74_17145 [Aeromicrobium sp.]
MRILTRRVAALAIVSTLTLAGCGGSDSGGDSGSDSSSSPSSSSDDVDAADGDAIKGTGYTYSVPDGWAVPEQDIAGTEQTDSFAADLEDTDGFADNVNVIRLDPAPLDDLDKLEDGLAAELEGAGSKDVTVGNRTEIDGDETVTITSVQTQAGKEYLTDQFNAIHDGVSYVITFSFSDTVSEADRNDLSSSVLASWKWTD